MSSRRAPLLAVAGLLVLVVVVHRLGPVLRTPYWVDEAWVAASSRVPLRDLPVTTASSPLGWTFLVWLTPAVGQVARLVPYLFLAGSVVAAYALGHLLCWRTTFRATVGGLAAGLSVLLLPAQLARHDLKQYTADACVALALFALLAWYESASRLVVLSVASCVGVLLSHPAIMVVGVVFLSLLVRGPRRRSLLVAAWAAPPVVVFGLLYVTIDRGARNAAMLDYWAGSFPGANFASFTATAFRALGGSFGMPWWLFAVLGAAGIAVVARLSRPATALALALLPVAAVVAGYLRLYPLFEQRTSHYLFVTWAALAGIGVAGLAYLAARRFSWVPPVVVAALLAVFALVNLGALRTAEPPGWTGEDVRSQVAYVAGHRAPGDVILVNLSGQYGFAYYWHPDRPLVERGGVQATAWYVAYPASAHIVVASDRTPAAVSAALSAALATVPPGRTLWLVRSHVTPSERAAWSAALAGHQVRTVTGGPEPLVTVS
jgi:hypothetical protein